eukprot:TRINITY_DN26739_c0_g1_i1.p1 TRINITY_DN26739_c0_g1~~TRINITY_DN26739_c0_g1_i1.p1  ORF type:complete len:536 (+),score=153.84 TRINITY_DN26739_c0_g1_i1:41-1609(+)
MSVPRLKWWKRIFASATREDTVQGVYHKLASEVSFLYAGFGTVGCVLWFMYGVKQEAVYDGMARNTLHRRWGERLYLSDRILFQTASHKVYSALNMDTGDCFVYAVHFPSKGVWSTRLLSDDEFKAQRIYALNGGVKASEFNPTDVQFYTRDGGILRALQNWWKVTTEVNQQAVDSSMPTAASNASILVRSHAGVLYTKVMFPWVAASLYWAAKFPFVLLWGADRDPAMVPKVYPENPTIGEWRTALKKVQNGIPIQASGGEIKLEPEMVTVGLNGVTLQMKPDVAAARRMAESREVYGNVMGGGCFLSTFFVFRKYWKQLASLPHDALYLSVSTKPRELATRMTVFMTSRLFIPRFAVSFLLLGHIFYENSESLALYTAKYSGALFAWDYAVALMLVKYAHSRSIPKALVVRGTIKDGHTTLTSNSFFKNTQPVGNITPSDAAEFDLVGKPSDVRKVREMEAMGVKERRWRKMLFSHDINKIKEEEEKKRQALLAEDKQSSEDTPQRGQIEGGKGVKAKSA